jgi:hypothetical protein
MPVTPAVQLLWNQKQTVPDVVDAIDRGAAADRVVGMDRQDRRRSDRNGADPGNSRCCPKISRPQEIRGCLLGNLWRVWSG